MSGPKLYALLAYLDQFKTNGDQMIDAEDEKAIVQIQERIHGYSQPVHYAFFKALLAATDIKSILMLGVYYGRDIAFILDILKRYHPGREIRIVGVDKFDDQPCADWPEEKLHMSWDDAGMGRAPVHDEAVANLTPSPAGAIVDIISSTDESFLTNHAGNFDFIYLDTSHDFGTVWRQCRTVGKVCSPDALICGDDYRDSGTWGVRRAVSQAFSNHTVFGNWIWMADEKLLNP